MIEFLYKNNPYKFNYQLPRTILASAQLSTLLFSNYNLSNNKEMNFLGKIVDLSIFNLDYIKWIPILILIWVISGYYYKLSGVAHFLSSFLIFQTQILVEGGEQICVIVTFLLMIICFGDQRKNLWNKDIKYTSNKFLFNFSKSAFSIIKIQVAIIYLFAASIKIKTDFWVEGSAMYYWINNPLFGANPFFRYILDPIFENHVFSSLITWGVLIIEFLLFGALFMNKRQKIYMFIGGVSLHVGIIFIMGLWSFGLIMIACLILYLEPDLRYMQEKILKRNFKIVKI